MRMKTKNQKGRTPNSIYLLQEYKIYEYKCYLSFTLMQVFIEKIQILSKRVLRLIKR